MHSITTFNLSPTLVTENFQRLVQLALQEDLADSGDITTQTIINPQAKSTAKIVAKSEGVIAGLEAVIQVFEALDAEVNVKFFVKDGEKIKIGEEICVVSGATQTLLQGERSVLNFLQRLSGVATLTAQFVAQTTGTHAKILDTRKTTPGWRILEKYAVRMGGGYNHRMGLFDMILIKNNHIDAAGSVEKAISLVLDKKAVIGKALIEVEVRNLTELVAALQFPINMIMLDNMSDTDTMQAVAMVKGKVPLEVSGNVTLERVKPLAEMGIDYLSVGALTHSAPALDLSMRVVRKQ